MLLYHGTTEKVARAALTEGLLTREDSGVESRWDVHPSSPEHVYLTETYAGYFALQASGMNERWGIVEVDTERLGFWDFVPDEDFLEQCSRGPDWPDCEEFAGIRAARTMEARTAWFRDHLRLFPHLWEDSVKVLGNCAHAGGIDPVGITRIALFDPKSNPSIAVACTDPAIMPLNHQICGDKYRALTAWLMGDAVDPACLVGFGWELFNDEQQEQYAEQLNKVSGLEVLTL